MPTAEPPSTAGGDRSRRWAWAGLAIVLAAGLGLRLWGVGQGLPFAYNTDEADHFVTHAVKMFATGSLNPRYFANPPAFTYLLHVLFAISYGGASGVVHTFAAHPAELYTLARVAAALLGTGALWLLYATGARLLGRGVGLLAAAIEAVAFLPVFYAHLALNDVPTLAPLTLSLLGSAGVLRRDRLRDYLIAGIGLGLACATKYTAGIAIVPFAAAVAARYLEGGRSSGRDALVGLVVAGTAALAAFLIANPYAILDFHSFQGELAHQSSLSAEAQGKLGAPKVGGLPYYLWALTWGLGWVPTLAALGGAIAVWRVDRPVGWMLVPAPLLFLAFMGLQGRYFGRWLLPIFPLLCLLAAFFALWVADAGARLLSGRRAADAGSAAAGAGSDVSVGPGARAALTGLVVAAMLAQGLVYSIHSGLVLSRPDTRSLALRWMLGHIPAGASIVVEPIAPNAWVAGIPGAPACPGHRWCKYPSLYSRISPDGSLRRVSAVPVGIEDYERTLSPALIDYYQSHGFCWVVSGSTQADRAFADPAAVPLAIAYYGALARRGTVVYRASPYGEGQGPVPFNFDWSFDYYPLAYHRPGPTVTIYRLKGGGCR
ncbi:MAG TPA: glycosyltransferase family 39 protein [Solirubrobacteraceae bacterium]|nr:glycosyltransferase family 39 protein [Solirubrobacteraceae bacterium]